MTTSKTTRRTVAFIPGIVGCLMLSLVSGCGLAMSNEDRLDRGEEAFAKGDFRAAIIDAKDVLLDEPDNLRGRLLLGRASVEEGDGPSAEKELLRAMAVAGFAAGVFALPVSARSNWQSETPSKLPAPIRIA